MGAGYCVASYLFIVSRLSDSKKAHAYKVSAPNNVACSTESVPLQYRISAVTMRKTSVYKGVTR